MTEKKPYRKYIKPIYLHGEEIPAKELQLELGYHATLHRFYSEPYYFDSAGHCYGQEKEMLYADSIEQLLSMISDKYGIEVKLDTSNN